MPVEIKSPNSDEIWDQWKQKNVKSQDLEKHYGIKGAVFSLENIAASEFVKGVIKAVAIYFEIEKQSKVSDKKGKIERGSYRRLEKERFFLFHSSVKANEWKQDKEVPFLDTISPIKCPKCNGQGFAKKKCGMCNGSGKIELSLDAMNEKQEKGHHKMEIRCPDCFGQGILQSSKCDECSGVGELFQYEIRPVPLKTTSDTEIVFLSSMKISGMEKELGRDIQEALDRVEGIVIKNPEKELDPKYVEAQLGFMDGDIKKILNNVFKDWKDISKSKDSKLATPIYLFPLISLKCETRKNKQFMVYSIGAGNKFLVFGRI